MFPLLTFRIREDSISLVTPNEREQRRLASFGG
jgi:hypothetical protein